MAETIIIEGRFPSLNDFIGAMQKHRLVGAKMKSDETERARLSFLKAKKYKVPVFIQFTWLEKNSRRDPDNVVFAKKFILDGMVKAGTIPNDTQEWIAGWEEVVDVDPSNPRIEVRILEIRQYEERKTP